MTYLFVSLPLLAFSVILYGLASFASGTSWINSPAFTVTLANTPWTVTGGDLFLWFSMALLFVEIVKSTATNSKSILNHGLSTIVFIVSFALMMLYPLFVTSAFANLVILTLIDTVGGFIITIVSARRDFDGNNSALLH